MDPDPYVISAKYYDDAYAAVPELIDLPFYLELAKRIGGPVLEMGCGTGRVLLPFARSFDKKPLDSDATDMVFVLKKSG
jgi:ubiquinone/menaquinone biosynthesis C-methylase UbiE